MKISIFILLCACATLVTAGGMFEYRTNILKAIRALRKETDSICRDRATSFCAKNSKGAAARNHKRAVADFRYETFIAECNREKVLDLARENAPWFRAQTQEAQTLLSSCPDLPSDLARQLKLIATTCQARQDDIVSKVNDLSSSMTKIYATTKVPLNGKQVPLEPDLEQVMARSRDYDQLLTAWKGWRDATGPKMKHDYVTLVRLLNIGATENGFKDMGECWRQANYEDKNFDEVAAKLWVTVEPIYKKLHAYVRRKLMNQYPGRGISATGPIPAHLLGNMWAQSWNNIMDIAAPYPGVRKFDVTDEMRRQNYTVMQMFKTAENFFTSIGLEKMTPAFWKNSMLVKPKGIQVVCHGSATDFHDGKDFRIKMCTEVTMDYLTTIHHEMGHIEYFMQYSHQPDVYRTGANAGFHEAVGDTMALNVLTPEHMRKLGLLPQKKQLDDKTEMKQNINFLMSKALEKIAFLPFGYMMDKWRWSVFNGATTKDNYNSKWWDLRLKYQGITPPVARTENDFDPGAKFHIPANVPYIRYFVSFITQFQFHKALCDAAGYSPSEPIHLCDVSAEALNSAAAGDKLKAMLSLGASKPWPDALEILTGSREIDASAMVNYFKPLIDWLDIENEKNNEFIGWRSSRD